MDEVRLKQAYDMFTAMWRFYRKYACETRTDDFWEAVDKEANNLRLQFPGTLCERLLLAMVDEFERG